MRRILLLATLLCGGAWACVAQEYRVANPDAMLLGGANIETVSVASAYSANENPAAILFGRQQMQLATSFFTFDGRTAYSAATYFKLGLQHAFAASWRNYEFEEQRKDKAVTLAYAYRLSEQAALGLSLNYNRFVRTLNGNAIFADVTTQVVVPIDTDSDYSEVRLGAKLSGIGGFFNGPSEMKLPVSAAGGVAYNRSITDAHAITLSAEGRYTFSPVRNRGIEGAIAAEYSLMQLLQFRVGYHCGESRRYYPNYATIGCGVRFMHLCFDVGYAIATSASPLHNAYSLSVGLDF